MMLTLVSRGNLWFTQWVGNLFFTKWVGNDQFNGFLTGDWLT